MEALNVAEQCAKRVDFDRLKTYSRAEAELVNWFSRVFRRPGASSARLKDVFAPWLEFHAGTAIHLSVINEIEQGESRMYRFDTDEVRIGRSSASDIVLGVRALGKQHARLIRYEGKYYLEDSGSAIGTYLNDRKLKAGQLELLSDGDRFLLFPFRFEVKLEDVWVRDEYLEVSQVEIAATTWDEFESASPAGFYNFEIGIYPDAGKGGIGVSSPFLETIVSRLTRAPTGPLLESDYGVLEFLIASIMERINRELLFPFQLALQRVLSSHAAEERGFKMDFCVALRESTGILRLFLPEKALRTMRSLSPAIIPPQATNDITWRVLICAGRIDLCLSEFSDLTCGDVVIFAQDMEIVLPQSARFQELERGWKARQVIESQSQLRVCVNEYFERSFSMEKRQGGTAEFTEAGLKPDLTTLPVRLHVVLGQVELSLAELNSLACNSILDLGRAKDDLVQLAANGRIIGSGALVDIDGMLGVEITNWSGS
jgi:type III secretion system YscQ/HrcQ family protein